MSLSYNVITIFFISFLKFLFRFTICKENPDYKHFLRKIRRFIKEKFSKFHHCIPFYDKIFCYRRHPPCLKSSQNDEIILSPPCRRYCKESGCEFFFNTMLYKILLELHRLYPSNVSYPRTESYSCNQFLIADMNNTEKCQNIGKMNL